MPAFSVSFVSKLSPNPGTFSIEWPDGWPSSLEPDHVSESSHMWSWFRRYTNSMAFRVWVPTDVKQEAM
jgi:hypothetical protein